MIKRATTHASYMCSTYYHRALLSVKLIHPHGQSILIALISSSVILMALNYEKGKTFFIITYFSSTSKNYKIIIVTSLRTTLFLKEKK